MTQEADNKPAPVVGVMVPEFPSQTHVAIWRVARSMRRAGATVHMLSTRRPLAEERVHPFLDEEAKRTFYAWPPRWAGAIGWLLRRPIRALAALGYILTLKETSASGKLKLLPLLASAGGLAAFANRHHIEQLLVHSCANAAHLVALCRLLDGPGYCLRLGGDMDVYGKDQAAKMKPATAIIAAAAINKQEIHDRVGLPDDRVIWSPLGADMAYFAPPEASTTPGEAYAGPLRLVSVSRLNRVKGIDDALHAMAKAIEQGHDLTYEIGGAGPERQRIEALIESLDLTGRVTMLGGLSQEQVRDVHRRADVFVLSSYGKGEASPAAMIEAMGSGLAVVATDVGGVVRLIDDGHEGLIVPQRDVEAMAWAFAALAKDRSRLHELGKAARLRAVRDFDVDAIARRILGVMNVTVPQAQATTALPHDASLPATASATTGGAA